MKKSPSHFAGDRPKEHLEWSDVYNRTAGILGANASGKTNLLKPLEHLSFAITSQFNAPQGMPSELKRLRDPHKLHPDETTEFHIEYVKTGIRYALHIELDDRGIVVEHLEANTSGRWKDVYKRERNSIAFGASAKFSKAQKELLSSLAKEWQLTLASLNFFNEHTVYHGALTWWNNVHTAVRDIEDTPLSMLRQGHLKEKKIWAELVELVAQVADTGVEKVTVRDEAVDDEQLAQLRSKLFTAINKDELTDEAMHKIFDRKELVFGHIHDDDYFDLSESEESLGTLGWFNLAMPSIEVLANGGVCIIDEIDSSLHPILVRSLISAFKDETINISGGQLLFTTHDSTIIGNHPEPAIALEETWIVEKSASESELIALDEFKIRAPYNLEKRYLDGLFGAVPWPNNNILRHAVKKLRDEELTGFGAFYG